MLASNRELAGKVHALERKVSVHERNIAELVDSMAALLATPPPPPRRSIGFVTQEEQPSKPKAAKGKAAASRRLEITVCDLKTGAPRGTQTVTTSKNASPCG